MTYEPQPILVMLLFVGLMVALVALELRKRSHGVLGVALAWAGARPLSGNHALRWIEAAYLRGLETGAPEAGVMSVLTGALHPAPGPHGVGTWTGLDGHLPGAALSGAGKARPLVFRGGDANAPGMQTEGDMSRDMAMRIGVEPTALMIAGDVAGTIDDAEALACLVMQGAAGTSAGVAEARRTPLLTSIFRQPRATRAVAGHCSEVVVLLVDFQPSSLSGLRASTILPSSVSHHDYESARREHIGHVVERLRGPNHASGCVLP